MTVSRNINTYGDVAQVLKAALEAGGGRYECQTKSAAITWRLRANTYRKLLLEQLNIDSPRGILVPTPYDHMKLLWTIEDPKAVTIAFDVQTGTFVPASGRAPARQMQPVGEPDPLLRLALEVAEDLENEE